VKKDQGCNGGMTYDAYTYLMKNYAYLEEDWKYTATDTAECTYE